MRMRRIARMFAVTLTWAALATAGEHKIEELAWLTGDWELLAGPQKTDEHWSHAAGGTMFATSRTIVSGKTVFFEFLRIETRESGIYFVGQPKGRPGTDFKLVRLDGQSVVFENLAHDFPKRILYRREADGSLFARVEGDGSESEKPQDYRYKPRK